LGSIQSSGEEKRGRWELHTLTISKSCSAAISIAMHLETAKTKPGNMGEILQTFVHPTSK